MACGRHSRSQNHWWWLLPAALGTPPFPLPGAPPYPLHSGHLLARADPPGVGALDGGHGEANEETHLPLLQAAELEALVGEEAQRVLQAGEEEEVEEVDQAQAAQAAKPDAGGRVWAPCHG